MRHTLITSRLICVAGVYGIDLPA